MELSEFIKFLREIKGFQSRHFGDEVHLITSVNEDRIGFKYPTGKRGWYTPVRMWYEVVNGDINWVY